MSWKTSGVVDERMRLVTGWERAAEPFSDLCARLGVSRTTGYRWVARWQAGGAAALYDRSHAADRVANRTPGAVEEAVVAARLAHPTWGPRKLGPLPGTAAAIVDAWPCPATIAAILARRWLSRPYRGRRRTPPDRQPQGAAVAPNDEWAIDGKGWRQLGDGCRCEPLTMLDQYSRYCLGCAVVRPWRGPEIRQVLERVFAEYGLPRSIRTDNGTPFAVPAAGGLSRLSVWWIQLGIMPRRGRPGHPQDNGRLERFHRTLEQSTLRPPAFDLASQQARFDAFVDEYNQLRPHQALDYQPPARLYRPSQRPLRPPKAPEYPDLMQVRMVRHNGELRWQGSLIYIAELLAGQPVGVLEEADGFGAWYGPVYLGRLDARKERLIRPR